MRTLSHGLLVNKTAVITGSTHGLGRATAMLFAREGASVAVTGRNVEAGKTITREIVEEGGVARFFPADLSLTADVEALVAGVHERFGPISALVNNAAGTEHFSNGIDGAITETSEEGWYMVLESNLMSAVRITRLVLRDMMRNGGGSIVNVTSIMGVRGVPGADAYTASKGALSALTRSIAVEYGEWNIRCNSAQVGSIAVRPPVGPPGHPGRDQMRVVRAGTPDDLAHAVLYLASDLSGFTTGSTLEVDGGATVKTPMPWVTARPARLDSSG